MHDTIKIKKDICITMYDTCDTDSLITLSLVNLKFPVTIIILFFFSDGKEISN